MENLVIGIDSGGTHTIAVLCDEKGNVLAQAQTGAASATGTPFDLAMENIKGAIDAVLCGRQAKCLFAGISGCGVPENSKNYTEYLKKAYPNIGKIRVDSDVYNPIYASIGHGDGIVAMCGTGSVAFAQADGALFRADGDGYLLGDEGGGYAIGRNTLNAALRMQDGRLEKGAIYDLCAERLGSPVREKLRELHEGGKTLIASFSPICFQAYAMGDNAARRILENAAHSMAESILACAKHIEGDRVPLVLSGSLWDAGGGLIRELVREEIGPRFAMRALDTDPAYGAAQAALAMLRGGKV
ncbi:MAG: N-acetylglucosamine kinase [Christensenellales bacterium]|jgi:N-acetylglucosamine kinase-like BadF-type ATPase